MTHPIARTRRAHAVVSFFPMFLVRLLVRLPTLAFGKCFERCLRIVCICIWGAAERTRRLFLPLASDNRALMALACRHDIIVLGDLRLLLPAGIRHPWTHPRRPIFLPRPVR